MPELPEVETVVVGLRPLLTGKVIKSLRYYDWPATMGGRNPEAFAQGIAGRQVEGIRRRAKHILIELDNGHVLGVHLRMTGSLTYHAQPQEPQKATRLIFDLADGGQLHFRDARKFGRVNLLAPDEIEGFIGHLGPEPLLDGFTLAGFRAMLASKKGKLKPLLLDQRFLAGLGNIYVDESLFTSKIHPLRQANTLSDEEIAALYSAIRAALQQGIDNRGASFDSYRDALGEKGGNQMRLNVYGRAGKPCPRCGAPIERIVVGGRGTHICPNCQRLDS